MKRVSTNQPNNDIQYYMRGREHAMNSVANKMSAQTRVLNLRDDPAAAAHSTRYASLIQRLERFSQNVSYAQDNHRITEGRVTEAVDVLQRVRELAVTGAHGTYSKEQLAIMGQEVNQLLDQAARETDPAKLKQIYTRINIIFLQEVPCVATMYRPLRFHTVNTSVWEGFPRINDGSNLPPTLCIDGYGFLSLFNLKAK
jgi:hypothetical protein